jgi:hypothetical protein
MSTYPINRRRFLQSSAVVTLAASLPTLAASPANAAETMPVTASLLPRMPVRQVSTDLLDIGYHQAGPEGGRPVILLHGFPYDIHSYVDVVPLLAAQGFRVICRTCVATALHAFSMTRRRVQGNRRHWHKTYSI